MTADPESESSAPLHLVLELLRQQNASDPYAWQFVPQTYLMRSAAGSYEASELAWTQAFVSDLAALRLPGRDPAVVQRVGDTLRRFLLPMEWSAIEAEIVRAVQQRRRVILTFRSAAAELYSLPWELLTIKSTGQHLGALSSVLFRYEWPRLVPAEDLLRSQRTPTPGDNGRILFCWSAAGGEVPMASHLRAIQQASAEGAFGFDPERDVLASISLEVLAARLKTAAEEGPPITALHLLCHGGAQGQTYGLWLSGDSSRGVFVDAGRLRDVLADAAGMLQLVVLAACDSGNAGALGNHLGSVAQALHRGGMKAVLASRYPLSVPGSVRLAEQLYRELLVDLRSQEEAVIAARSSLVRDPEQLDWASLQLYARAPETEEGAEGGGRPFVFRPYRGLLAFQPEHRRFFFGREREITELVGDVKALLETSAPRLLAVDGASGTGKSSVLFAGALPRLLAQLGEGARSARLRPGHAPIEALERALATREGTSPLLLLCDQLEELFTHVEDPRVRQSFARRLWELATATDSGVFVVLTIRSDYVGRCGELVLDGSGLRLDRVIYEEGHRVSIAQMSAAQLRDAITGPARRVGLRLEPGLTERLLADVESEPGALPLLSDTLDLLWQRRAGSTLTQAAYDALGGVTGALQGRADALIESLDAEDQRLARRLLVRLVNVGEDLRPGTRRRVDAAALRPADPAQAARFERVLIRLIEARLLVLSEERGQPQVEVAHEALLRRWPRLTRWVQADRKMLAELDKLEGWVEEWRERGTLLTGNQLGYAAEVARSYGEELSEEARALLQKSEEERARANERDQDARDTLRVLAAEELEADLTRAAVILREVESRDPRKVRGFLPLVLEILQEHALTLAELRGHTDVISAVAFSADGQQVITVSSDQTVRAWSADGSGESTVLCENGSNLFNIALDHKGAHLVQEESDALRLYSLRGDRAPVLLREAAEPTRQLLFSPDDRSFAAAIGLSVWIWDVENPDAPIELAADADTSQITALAFSPDSRQLVTGDANGRLQLWTREGERGPSVRLSAGFETIRALVIQPPPPGRSGAAEGARLLVFCDSWGAFRVFELATLQLVLKHEALLPTSELLVSSADGSLFAYGSGPVLIFDREGRGIPLRCAGHRGSVRCAAFSPDARRLVTGDEEGVVRIWDLAREPLGSVTVLGPIAPQLKPKDEGEGEGESGAPSDSSEQPENEAEEPPETDNDLAMQLAGNKLLLDGDGRSVTAPLGDGRALLWQLPDGLRGFLRPKEASHDDRTLRSPDGRWEAALLTDGQVDLHGHDERGEPIQVTVCPDHVVRFLFSPDSRYLLIVPEEAAATLWRLDPDVARREPITLGFSDGAVTCAAFSPDGSQLLISARRAQIFGVSGELRAQLSDAQLSLSVDSAAFSPDGEHVLTFESSRTRLWSMKGKKVPFLSPASRLVPVAVDAAWRRLLTGPGPLPAAVWELDLDPASIVRRLWRATPFCLSIEERQLLLGEPRELATKNYEQSRERARREKP